MDHRTRSTGDTLSATDLDDAALEYARTITGTYPRLDGEGDGGDGGGDGGGEGGTGDGTADGNDGTASNDGGNGDGTGRAGGPDALRRDLATERDKRQAAEARVAELEQQHESETERLTREAREAGRSEILDPALDMARRHAVEDVARTVGFVDPLDAVGRLRETGALADIDVDTERLEVADTDAVRELVDKIAEDAPHLLTPEARDALEENGTPRPRGGPDTRGGGGSGAGSDASSQFMGALRRKARR